jgi:hypothetical protein
MNKRLSNKMKTYRAAIQVWDDNKALWEKIPIIVLIYNEIKKLLANIEADEPTAGATTNGLTEGKHTDKSLFIAEFFKLTSAIFAYATRTENASLKNMVNFPISDLEYYREETLLSIYTSVMEWLTAHVTELADYGVTKEEVDNLAVLKANFFKGTPTIRATVTGRKATNEMVRDLFAQVDTKFTDEADKLMERFLAPNPKFYNAYWYARNFIDYGVRHEKTDTGTTTGSTTTATGTGTSSSASK